jgi:hypothetical protein
MSGWQTDITTENQGSRTATDFTFYSAVIALTANA